MDVLKNRIQGDAEAGTKPEDETLDDTKDPHKIIEHVEQKLKQYNHTIGSRIYAASKDLLLEEESMVKDELHDTTGFDKKFKEFLAIREKNELSLVP
eukprot:TRINITY_DN3929_c0_g1_i1.p1 TRINITY_DN3929_c0_g1~~TRINITY_DN3929_c0_g1_i1.p1  ORF type:complete len:97 (+),score=17.25 TRINITY_DN3929_c0_g1_i1:118-408(+)